VVDLDLEKRNVEEFVKHYARTIATSLCEWSANQSFKRSLCDTPSREFSSFMNCLRHGAIILASQSTYLRRSHWDDEAGWLSTLYKSAPVRFGVLESRSGSRNYHCWKEITFQPVQSSKKLHSRSI